MNSIEDEMYESQEESSINRLAEVLEVDAGLLQMTTYEINTDEKDGVVRHLLVEFDDSSPKEILDKIKGLDGTNTVWLDPHALDRRDLYPPDDEDKEEDDSVDEEDHNLPD
jgi:hypothetical protein